MASKRCGVEQIVAKLRERAPAGAEADDRARISNREVTYLAVMLRRSGFALCEPMLSSARKATET